MFTQDLDRAGRLDLAFVLGRVQALWLQGEDMPLEEGDAEHAPCFIGKVVPRAGITAFLNPGYGALTLGPYVTIPEGFASCPAGSSLGVSAGSQHPARILLQC